MYRAYVKNALALNEKPTMFFRVNNATFGEDLLTSKTSKFEVIENTSGVESSDVFFLLNDSGQVVYMGVVDSVEDKTINTSQMQSFYKGLWLYQQYSSAASLEAEVAKVTEDYASGKIYGSNAIDSLMLAEKGIVSVTYSGSTNKKLPSQDDNYTKDFEEFIYWLYNNYNITFNFVLPYEWEEGDDEVGRVVISVPNYETLKISDNTHIIQNLVPTVEIYENNKLIVYDSEGTFRGVYYGTKNGITTDSSDENRLKTINTNIVFSDDSIGILEAQNLRSDMYNHYISFELITDNKLYDFSTWHLGQPLKIYHKKTIYDTVYTGYEKEVRNGVAIGKVKVSCGKVRINLTDKLNMILK